MIPSHRNQLRRWAARMLLVWLFGVVVGVANACVLAPELEHASHPAVAEHNSSDSRHGPGDKAPGANCQAFCDLSSSAVPSQSVAVDQVALAAIAVGFATVAVPVAQPLRLQRVTPAHRNSAPPIPIAFLHLAL